RRPRRRVDLPGAAEGGHQHQLRAHKRSAVGPRRRQARRRQRGGTDAARRQHADIQESDRRPDGARRPSHLSHRWRRWLRRSGCTRSRGGRRRHRQRLHLGRGGVARLRSQHAMLSEERRRRLAAAMADAGINEMICYGNAWQGDYLRYAADFGILEGHGIAIVGADGSVELFVDSAVEAERAEAEAPGIKVAFARDIARAVGTRLDRVANHRLAAAPRRFVPKWLAARERSFALEDGTALLDKLLMHKLPAEIDAIRAASKIADDAYAVFRDAVKIGRPQYELVADVEAYLRSRGCA